MRHKNKTKTIFFPTPPFFRESTSLLTLLPSHHPRAAQKDVEQSCCQFIMLHFSAASFFPHAVPLLQSEVPDIGKSPSRTAPIDYRSCQKNTLLFGLPMGCSFLQGTSTFCGIGTSTGCRVDICFDVVLSTPGRGQPVSPWSSSGAAGVSLFQYLEHLLPCGVLAGREGT